ncbi:MAG: tetratricopeptide repeat protein [Ignavibacteria bacterium]|nr:tetratricopeptide repeat protein [Ignavibacteria bacterium]
MNAYYNAYLNRANYLMNHTKFDEAEKLLNKAVEVKPNSPDAKQMLGKIKQLRTIPNENESNK